MISKKYIIRNCPCFDKYSTQCYDTPTSPITDIPLCQDCTDCLLKQIVKQAGYCLCPEILELLDIQEVE